MGIYRKVPKDTNITGVGGEGKNEKEKSIECNKGGDTTSKVVGGAHGLFRQSKRHHSETTCSKTRDAAVE